VVSCWMGGEHVYAPHYNPTTPYGEPCFAGPPPNQASWEAWEGTPWSGRPRGDGRRGGHGATDGAPPARGSATRGLPRTPARGGAAQGGAHISFLG
jgi:hypothetical protein